MRNRRYLVIGILVCLCLSGCSKKIDSTQSSDSFGDAEESNSLVESSEEKK